MSAEESIANLRKKRGVVRSSITRLGNNLTTLEGSGEPDVPNHAALLVKNLERLDAELRSLHFKVIDLVGADDEETLEREQDYLDRHDETVTELQLRLQKLTAVTTTDARDAPISVSHKTLSRKLLRMEQKLRDALGVLNSMSDTPDQSLVELYHEQLIDDKKTLSSIYDGIMDLDLDDGDELLTKHPQVEHLHFQCSHKVKKLRGPTATGVSADAAADAKGMKLPKLDVPTFDGDILNWAQFWEQFSISVHKRRNLSDAEKLVYLQQAIKRGSAKSTIEGLTRTGENYEEAISCLKSRFDRPRLIYRTHVQKIMDAPSLKDGNGKELRRLHDTIQQHIRALKSMDDDLSGAFVTSIVELKLDTDTLFEWQRHSQAQKKTPHYDDLLNFIDLRAQASETSTPTPARKPSRNDQASGGKQVQRRGVPSYAAHADHKNQCVLCSSEKHPLYSCPKFKDMAHAEKLSTLKDKNLCHNCLGSGHIARQCKSLHKCRKCQRPHHTLLHIESPSEAETPVSSNAAVRLKSSPLLMTCRVVVTAPNGASMEARALLDNASSASFVTERLAQGLNLPRSRQNIYVSGITGVSPKSPAHSVVALKVSPTKGSEGKIDISAIVVPKVTCDLPLSPVQLDSKWSHVTNLPLADPDYGKPGRIDILLGVEVFLEVLLQGRRSGPPGSPVALETLFGWVLSGGSGSSGSVSLHAASLHTTTVSGDDLLRRFWEVEEGPSSPLVLSPEEKFVIQHYEDNHSRTSSGRFVVPLPRKPDAAVIGESRSQAVRRFLSLERSLHSKSQFQDFDSVMSDYFIKGHAEPVPATNLEKPTGEVFYLPMHAVRKESSTTTKIRAVFDASAKSSTGVSLNDTLLVGPTVHPPLIDVLLRFRFHRIALTTDVSQMYRAIELIEPDRDLHRFVWRSNPNESLRDYRMTRATFGVSASSFAANMSVRQNAVQLALKYPQVIRVVKDSFYVDDGLTGADTVDDAVNLQQQLQQAFEAGGFILRKWNSSHPAVLEHIPSELRDVRSTHGISEFGSSTKALGLEWNVSSDCFHLTIAEWPSLDTMTKRSLVSDIAKTFDVLGWFGPTIITMKILLQRLWELKLEWDEPVPPEIYDTWLQWRSELPSLATKSIPRCYYPKTIQVTSVQLHGFSDASEDAYAGVVYLRFTDSEGSIHVSLVMSKTRVAPIKRLSIPRLELCGAQLLAGLLQHTKEVFQLSTSQLFAWTDSTIVLSWLNGNPRRFKTFVGNRVSAILDSVPPSRWNHVAGLRIQLTVRQEVYLHLSCSVTGSGGKGHHGFNSSLLTGRSKVLYHPTHYPRRRRRSV